VVGTLESCDQTAERKALHAICVLLHSTFQCCYCVKEICLQALCVQILSPVTLAIRKVYSTLVCQKNPVATLLKVR